MAKSFKQLSSGTVQPTKRTSEIDLLDFLEQDRQTTVATTAATTKPAAAPATDSSASTAPARAGGRPAADAAAPEAAAPARKAPGRPKAVAPAQPAPVAEQNHVTDVAAVAEAAVDTAATGADDASDSDVRQTFVLSRQYLEKLKNFVHTQRMGGQYDFTQKQALHQALDLLFDNAEIEERPLQIRQKEEVRRQQIRKGRGR